MSILDRILGKSKADKTEIARLEAALKIPSESSSDTVLPSLLNGKKEATVKEIEDILTEALKELRDLAKSECSFATAELKIVEIRQLINMLETQGLYAIADTAKITLTNKKPYTDCDTLESRLRGVEYTITSNREAIELRSRVVCLGD